jgi:acetylornithine deacetylase/succinyl-diaminopimelate desuccinylase-like protein
MKRLDQLTAFLKFPSISAQAGHASDVDDCADWLVAKLSSMGFQAKKTPTKQHPIVTAVGPHVPGKPTVLIYGHYDVQPVDPMAEWKSDPFSPEVRDGRLYARGASDDKGEIMAHLLGVEELMEQEGGTLPLNVKFIFEGEEEIGSLNLPEFLRTHKDELACDVVVVSDTGMVAPNTPTISYGLRGVAGLEVVVHGPEADLHSGIFGGAVANPARVLADLISSCYDAEGHVAVEGFYDGVDPLATWERNMWANLPGMHNDELAALVGVPALAPEAGYTGAECIYARPTLEINGMGAGYMGEGSKTIIPSSAFAKITCRLVPGQDATRIQALLEAHLSKHAPNSVRLSFHRQHTSAPYLCDPNSAFSKAAQEALTETFGTTPVLLREGGSIGSITEFKDVLGVDSLLIGLCLPDARIHSPNENIPVDLFNKGVEMSQNLLRRLAQVKF